MVQERKWECISRLEGGLIASCQASTGEPLCHPDHILAMSLSAVAGGAIALRLEGTENIKVVRESKDLPAEFPIVGLIKSTLIAAEDRLKKAYITSTFEEAQSIVDAGADIVALDATGRDRPDGNTVASMIEKIHAQLNRPVWADCATFSEGIAAAKAGADIVSTTLFGYTEETKSPTELGPALDLLKNLCDQLEIPVILEGRVWHPYELTEAFELGAYAVVVGSAITRPTLITERFAKAIPLRRPKKTLA